MLIGIVATLWAAKTAAEAVSFAVLGINAGIATYAIANRVTPTKVTRTRVSKSK